MARRTTAFSDQRVAHLKQLLINGTDPVALAIQEGCSANTIRRIRDGETYNHVKVPGEERMRRQVEVVGWIPPDETSRVVTTRSIVVEMVPDEEVEALAQRMMARQEANAGVARVEAPIDESAETRAKRMLGVID